MTKLFSKSYIFEKDYTLFRQKKRSSETLDLPNKNILLHSYSTISPKRVAEVELWILILIKSPAFIPSL